MEKTLFSLVQQYRTISISGMCKNAGKTTALNNLIKSMPASEKLALTSIGWDGEKEDIVTGTHKPGIYIREGTIFATAKQLLKSCDITKEILDATNISTPMGDVIILRALSDGNVQMAGPSMVTQLIEISKQFRDFGVDRIIIDGAAGRKSLCTRALAEASILCTGASFSPNMQEVISETGHTCRLLMTKEVPSIAKEIETEENNVKFIIFGDEKTILPDGADLTMELKQAKAPQILYIEGAVTDSLLDPIIRMGFPRGLKIVTRDASRLLITSETQRRLEVRKGQLGVLEEINLAAITINPFSAYGTHFDKAEFMDKMTAAVPIPVVDVVAEEPC